MIKLADTLTPMSNDFYAVESENVGIDIDGTSKSIQQAYDDGDLSSGGSSIQVDTMPIASVDELGKIYEFIGSTGTYVNGYFYECISDGEPTPTYSWVQKNVQPNAESFTFNEDDFNVDSSTDKVSLLPSRRVFNGSKADWDLLSVAEKTQYGATAFTDDEGEAQSWEDLSSQITTSTTGVTLTDVKCYKKGNLVSLSFDITIASDTILEPATRLFVNIPKPKNTNSIHVVSDVSNNQLVWGLISSQDNGFLCPGYNDPCIGVGRITGLIEYFSED